MNVSNKSQMYQILLSGGFGNTNPSHHSVSDWQQKNLEINKHGLLNIKKDSPKFWGIRSYEKSNDPRCKMFVHWSLVWRYAIPFGSEKINISPMIDNVLNVMAFANVVEMVDGLHVDYVLEPKRSWREEMLNPSNCKGSQAIAFLKTLLNENSYDDLKIVLENYPGHVVEMSITDRCYGTVPGRNAVVWEVRNY